MTKSWYPRRLGRQAYRCDDSREKHSCVNLAPSGVGSPAKVRFLQPCGSDAKRFSQRPPLSPQTTSLRTLKLCSSRLYDADDCGEDCGDVGARVAAVACPQAIRRCWCEL
jgi:hypothetical protein